MLVCVYLCIVIFILNESHPVKLSRDNRSGLHVILAIHCLKNAPPPYILNNLAKNEPFFYNFSSTEF